MRTARNEQADSWYHITQRGRGREAVFRTAKDARLFLALMGEASHRHGLEIHGYCLMTNHYHLLVRNTGGTMGESMRHMLGRYVQRFNRAYGLDGQLFSGRYHSTPIVGDRQALNTIRYIHRNPVDAYMVDHAAGYRWSSQEFYDDPDVPHAWLRRDVLLGVVGGSANFRRFVDQSAPTDKRNVA